MCIEISVVIPTYNRPELLLRCLRALLKQDFDPEKFEIIVVNDGPDGAIICKELCKRPYPAVRYYVTPEKKGPAAARNYGWLNARASLVAFTDDDCLPDRNWLRSFYEAYKHEDVLAFTGKTVVPISDRPTDYERNTANLQTAGFITANCCCTKSALLLTGGFDEQFTMAWREDSDLEFKLITANIPIQKVDDASVIHPVRPVEWGISIKEQKKTMFNALLYKKFPELYRQKIQPLPPFNYYLIVIGFLLAFFGLVFKNHYMFITGLWVWLFFSLLFIAKRLQSTTLAVRHFFEMVITSLFIPFLSVYWQFYGAIKYRTLFL